MLKFIRNLSFPGTSQTHVSGPPSSARMSRREIFLNVFNSEGDPDQKLASLSQAHHRGLSRRSVLTGIGGFTIAGGFCFGMRYREGHPLPPTENIELSQSDGLQAMPSSEKMLTDESVNTTENGKEYEFEALIELAENLGLSKKTVQKLESLYEKYSRIAPDGSYLRTVLEQAFLSNFVLLLSRFFKKIGVKTGNTLVDDQQRQQKMKKSMLKSYLGLVTWAPGIEEAFYRYLPAFLFTGQLKGSPNWLLNLVTSTWFAGAHMFFSKTHRFNPSRIPVQQFILGVYFFRTMRLRGPGYNFLAHALHNSLLPQLPLILVKARIKGLVSRRS